MVASSLSGHPLRTSASGEGIQGASGATSGDWTNRSEDDCDDNFRIYCFEQSNEESAAPTSLSLGLVATLIVLFAFGARRLERSS